MGLNELMSQIKTSPDSYPIAIVDSDNCLKHMTIPVFSVGSTSLAIKEEVVKL
jgi:hypothetical protein